MPTTTFAQLLKQQRKKLGLTQEQLAREVSVVKMTITMYESGRRYPEPGIAEHLAALFYPSEDEAAARSDFITLARRPHATFCNVPMMFTPLIGRDKEIANLIKLLEQKRVPIITVKGPPGIGKTHLASEAAVALRNSFSEGIYFVDLAAAREAEHVVDSIAQVLSRNEAPMASLERSIGSTSAIDISSVESPQQLMSRLLPTGRVLLLLDGLDYVDTRAVEQLLLALVHEHQALKVLVTSRRALQIRGEHIFEAPALPCLSPACNISRDQAANNGAVELFVTNAKTTKPDFTLTDTNYKDVVAICDALGGLPLAIELMAKQSGVYSPHDVWNRLLPEMHADLSKAFDVVYSLLTCYGQALFRRLGVFVESCSLETITAVSRDIFTAHGIEQDSSSAQVSLEATLKALIDHSLLQRTGETDESRYTMLKIIRTYAYKRLAMCDETIDVQRSLTTYYLEFIKTISHDQQGFQRLALDEPNLQAAMRWAMDRGDVETAAQLCDTLVVFWQQRGAWNKGRAWLEEILQHADRLSKPLYGRVLRHAGLMARRQGDYLQAQELFKHYLSLCREAEDERNAAFTLNLMGLIAAHQGDYEQAEAYYEESLKGWAKLGSLPNIAAVKGNLASLASIQGAYDRASKLHKEARDIRMKINDTKGVIRSLCNEGIIKLHQGDYDVAQVYFESSLKQMNGLLDPYLLATILCNLGFSLLAQDKIQDAVARFRESLSLYKDLGDQRGIAYGIEGCASVAALQQQTERAARLFGAADALREHIAAPRPHVDTALYDLFLAKGQILRDVPAYIVALDIGRCLSLEQAIVEALGDGPFLRI